MSCCIKQASVLTGIVGNLVMSFNMTAPPPPSYLNISLSLGGNAASWRWLATNWVIFRFFSEFFCTFQIPHKVHQKACHASQQLWEGVSWSCTHPCL